MESFLLCGILSFFLFSPLLKDHNLFFFLRNVIIFFVMIKQSVSTVFVELLKNKTRCISKGFIQLLFKIYLPFLSKYIPICIHYL